MKPLIALLSLLLATVPAAAQPQCETVYLPDLAGPTNEPVTAIATHVYVPPVAETTNSEGLYPFHVLTTPAGDVAVTQVVGHVSKAVRYWGAVKSVSLVFWMHDVDRWTYAGHTWVWGGDQAAHVWEPHRLYLIGYKTLPTTAPLGQQTPWYRTTHRFQDPTANLAVSTPVQLGEQWNVALVNTNAFGLWVHLQIEARICR